MLGFGKQKSGGGESSIYSGIATGFAAERDKAMTSAATLIGALNKDRELNRKPLTGDEDVFLKGYQLLVGFEAAFLRGHLKDPSDFIAKVSRAMDSEKADQIARAMADTAPLQKSDPSQCLSIVANLIAEHILPGADKPSRLGAYGTAKLFVLGTKIVVASKYGDKAMLDEIEAQSSKLARN